MQPNYLWLLLLIPLFIIVARHSRPGSNVTGSPLQLNNSSTRESQPLTIATYNIQSGKNVDGERDIFRAAKILAESDLAGVQEVHAASWPNKLGIGDSQTDSLVLNNDKSGVFAATRRRWFREHRGNAVLSRLTIPAWRAEMLPTHSGKSYRNMMIAEVKWQGNSFHFINTHLHTGKGRDEQLASVLAEAAKYPRIILVGDFNSRPNTSQIRDVLATGDLEDAIKEAGLNQEGDSRIDWILTRGFNIQSGRYVGKGVSDHAFYEVSLSYK